MSDEYHCLECEGRRRWLIEHTPACMLPLWLAFDPAEFFWDMMANVAAAIVWGYVVYHIVTRLFRRSPAA